MRAQLHLPALGVALLLVTAAMGVSLGVAHAAFEGADSDPVADHAATVLADRLVAADGEVALRANVLDADALYSLDAAGLRALARDTRVRGAVVRVDGRTVAEYGDASGGHAVRRIVLVAETTTRTVSVVPGEPVRIDELPSRVVVTIDSSTNAAVRTVRVNGRPVLANDSGLVGRFVVHTSRARNPTLAFETDGRLSAGSVRVMYAVERTTPSVLEVVVDA